MPPRTPTAPERPWAADPSVRIGWLCHLIRIAAAALAAWPLVQMIWFWRDPPAIARAYGAFLKPDLSGTSALRYTSAIALGACGWALYAAISYCIWRQFGTYLRGRVFTVEAATWMRRVGTTGCIALVFSLLARHLVVIILAYQPGLPLRAVLSGPWAGPFDALQALFFPAIIGLAQIYDAAAELADDHARIV